MRALLFFAWVCVSVAELFPFSLLSNESELLSVWDVQAVGMPLVKESLRTVIRNKNARIKAVPNIFTQQNGIHPLEGEIQSENFGATMPWNDVLNLVNGSRRLLIMIRHAQAWENLNPLPNSACEFEYDGETVQNFDSALSPEGERQAEELNSLFASPSDQSPTSRRPRHSASTTTWFEALGLSRSLVIASPLTRTMQTADKVLKAMPVSAVPVHEIIRASIGNLHL
jgi:hypothetical protein